MRMRSHSNLKVVLGLLCPFTIFLLEFKSREELMLQPQTAAEHEDDINESSSSSSSSSESDSSSDSDYSSDEDSVQGDQDGEKRKNSSSSVQSLNLAGVSQVIHQSRAGASEPSPFRATIVTSCLEVGAEVNSKSCKHDHRHRHHADNASMSHVPNGLCSRFVTAHRKDTTSNDNELNANNSNTLNNVFNLAAQNLQRTRPIKLRRRLYEFYVAPVTTFWAWSLSFIAFICCNTYTLLVKTPLEPTGLEWAIFVYMVAFGLEHFRKVSLLF
ncbi:unnamed protein product [Toxocara canis]|uniref:Uncharacterized protein n=1 Tax=Toxocara canis TaxID=6265 RepID=A0A3P7H0I4_TOXCA|nr:unnamed protein product [Toxocara canis]